MILGIVHTTLLVREYEEAKEFYCGKLGFEVLEDSPHPNGKRWVRLGAPGGRGSEILVSRAVSEDQRASIGKQAGGRVLFFLQTDSFDTDYSRMREKGVVFTEGPSDESYGRLAVFKDLYGNRIDLVEFKPGFCPTSKRRAASPSA
jgi:catechol 2,3-dioxygenase-like lactoylglutathione lyase family enzyme